MTPDQRVGIRRIPGTEVASVIDVMCHAFSEYPARSAFRGRGLARRLLEAVQDLSRATPGSQGVTLTTESPGNVALYERAGYQVVGYARVAPELESWGMFRPN